MSDERRDYGILVTYSMREEAEVAAAALRAEGIDAFVSPDFHATYDWHLIQALGGLKVFVPWQKLEEGRAIIRARIAEAKATPVTDPEEAPVRRKDRYKVWLVIAWTVGMGAYSFWLGTLESPAPVYELRVGQAQVFFAAPEGLTAAQQEAALLDYCLDYPWHRVVEPGSEYAEIVGCRDIIARN